MRITIIFCALVFLVGCGSKNNTPDIRICYDKAIPTENMDKAAQLVVDGLAAMTPQELHENDDEDEWVYALSKTAKAIYGIGTIGIEDSSNTFTGCFIPYWDLDDEMKQLCDKWDRDNK